MMSHTPAPTHFMSQCLFGVKTLQFGSPDPPHRVGNYQTYDSVYNDDFLKFIIHIILHCHAKSDQQH